MPEILVSGPDAGPAPAAPAAPAGPLKFADLDADEFATVSQGLDWAGATGAGLVALGLLLPWSSSVIGASGVDSYLDTWGLAGPAHILVLAWAIAIVVTSLRSNPVPAWIRLGVAGLALGVFALGLTWPYLIGPLGAGIGVVAVMIGALVLIGAGLASLWVDRHAPGVPTV